MELKVVNILDLIDVIGEDETKSILSVFICQKNPEIEKEFQNKDWDKFDEKQLIFDGDTMHLCKY